MVEGEFLRATQDVDRRHNDPFPQVTFVITAGRRFNLFKRTMDSFLHNCLDMDLISRWICILDRASVSEQVSVACEYPFLEIVHSPAPGQAAALNHLYFSQDIATEWVVHWEDDWLTIKHGHFIRLMLQIAATDQRIRNVVLRGWQGVEVTVPSRDPKRIAPLRYRVHLYWPRSGTMRSHDSEWYGYSLNPGLQHVPTVHQLGKYDEDLSKGRYFDRPQATKYSLDLKLLRANPLAPYVEHIGEKNPAWRLEHEEGNHQGSRA